MAVIFYLSSLSNPRVPVRFPDYILHGIEYFLLNLLLLRGFLIYPVSGNRSTLCLLSVGLATFYGISDEFHQLFVPHREFSLHDMTADFVGALLAIGVFYMGGLLKNLIHQRSEVEAQDPE